jgi:hypothetical protein
MTAAGDRPVAVATDVGAWRVVEPVVRTLEQRGTACRVLLGGPAASIAAQDGVAHRRLGGASLDEQVAEVLALEPTRLLLGTSVQPVAERALTVRVRDLAPPIPTLAVLDAMLFVERRFGGDLDELTDLVACPDPETVARLTEVGAPAGRLVVTGNPTLEEIGLSARSAPPDLATNRPTDVLFVSSPVEAMRRRGTEFAIDERQTLDDVLAALNRLRSLSPAGFRVRVRWHPVQRPDRLPTTPPGITLESDDEPDRLRSCARARVVVGLSSTLLGEARMLPRAAVAYLPGPYWDRERVFAPSYGVRLARSPEEVHGMLAEALAQPPDPPPLAGHVGASARVADLFERMVGRPTPQHSHTRRDMPPGGPPRVSGRGGLRGNQGS